MQCKTNSGSCDAMGEMTGFGRATMHVLDATGDTKIMWNPRDKDETKNAKETFKRLADKGFQAFLVNAEGAPGERISEFDKNAEKIIFVPRLAGG